MILKDTKIVIALSMSRDDLDYLRQVGEKYGAKNNSMAFRYLIERMKHFERQLIEIKKAAQAQKKPYEEVRNDQIKKEAAP
jgi:fructose-1,6-bisphosphatase